MKPIKTLSVIGTRPEAIKMAPLIKRLNADLNFESILVSTGQQKEQLDQVLDLFKLVPKYDLKIMKHQSKLEELLSTMLIELSKILEQEKPDVVLVHGDTATTLAAAQAAFFKQIPIAHIEAGLRTNNLKSPFPEEANRQMVSRLSSYHFSPTEQNKQNLLKENIDESKIYVVGNTGIDSLLDISGSTNAINPEIQSIVDNDNRIISLTVHRRENLSSLKNIFQAVNKIVAVNKDVEIVFPIHMNPLIRECANEELNKDDRIHIIEPLDYANFSYLLRNSYFVMTDSGGIQEEAPAFKIPVLVLRDTTERTEGLENNTLKLVGTNRDLIFESAQNLLVNNNHYSIFTNNTNPYGEGKTSETIISTLYQEFRGGWKPYQLLNQSKKTFQNLKKRHYKFNSSQRQNS